MSFEQFKKIYDEIRPVKINVSGLGEPFLNPDVFKIIRYARRGGSAVNCATNLTLVGDKIEEIIDSGIGQLKVSIDAHTRETFLKIRKFDLYETLVANIKKINALKKERNVTHPEIRLNFALQKDNIDELIPTIKLAKELGIKAMFIQYLAYVDREDRKEKLVGDITREKLTQVIDEADALTKEYAISTNLDMWKREFEFFWQNMQPGQYLSPEDKPCYFPWFSAWIDADGTVRPCPIIPWRKGVAHMGNVFSESFKTIWNSEAYCTFRKVHVCGKRPTDVCRTCIPVSLSSIFTIGSKLLPK
jgi:radical SAM protein with 4Fe4S-binding SPASM domain